MRKGIVIFVLTCIITRVAAQDSSIYQATADRFAFFYKAQQPDSIYKMFSPTLQSKLLPTLWGGTFAQLLRMSGTLGAFHEEKPTGAYRSFTASTDKPDQGLNLAIDSAGSIAGLHLVQKKVAKASAHSSFSLPVSGGTLYGTLLLPKDTGRVNVMIIIPGSGPVNRDGNSGNMLLGDSYKLLAEALRDSGIATLRYDKRWVGESDHFTGPLDSLSFDDVVNDAAALIDTLKKDPRFSSVTVFGHSEGSLIGMMACYRSSGDKYISAAGIGYGIDTILLKQLAAGGQASNVPLAKQLLDSIKAGYRIPVVNDSLQAIVNPIIQKYMYTWMGYHPKEEIAKLHIPVLIIQGLHDIQVDQANAEVLKAAYPAARLVEIRTMSHILKDAPADRELNIESYKNIYLPLNREFVRTVARFIKGTLP